jgi:hypothetical protein
MGQPAPLWRQAFDVAERAVTPRVEAVVRTDHFARGAALATQAQAFAWKQVENVTSRLWHVINLPAGSDVARLRAQIGALDREVRRLTLKLEQHSPPGAVTPVETPSDRGKSNSEESADAGGARSAQRPRPSAARRRT